MRSKISTQIRNILTSLLVVTAGTDLFAIPQDPDISQIVYTNGGKQDSTGYYGYLVGLPGAYSVTVNPNSWFAWPFYKYSYNFKPHTDTYAMTVSGSLFTAAKARATRGLLPLNEDYRLDVAAMMISREMFRQQWIGVDFPDGKALASFLRSADWQGDQNSVVAITTVCDAFRDTFAYGQQLNPGYVVKNFPQAVNPAVLTMGYAQNYRLRDLHGNQIGSGRVLVTTMKLCSSAQNKSRHLVKRSMTTARWVATSIRPRSLFRSMWLATRGNASKRTQSSCQRSSSWGAPS